MDNNPAWIFSFLIVLVVVGVAAVIGIRLFVASVERRRIVEYVEQRGGRLIDWIDLGSSRPGVSEVRYRDHEGNIHEALAHFGMFSGVSFSEDRIVHRARPAIDSREVEALQEENARLRAEVERLKGGATNQTSHDIQE
jgi:hypothetical protein